MKYAVISDVHGNFCALEAVLEDAYRLGVDRFIFAGDYSFGFHCPNRTTDLLKSVENSVIVRGNQEGYYVNLKARENDRQNWTDGQFEALYWTYDELADENIEFLTTLPKNAVIKDGDTGINIAHSSSSFFGDVELKEFSSAKFRDKYRKAAFLRDSFYSDIHQYFSNNTIFKEKTENLANGIYIFGHTHMQWHLRHNGKLLINPGSCGLALDYDDGAPYTVLDVSDNEWTINERRVLYDAEKFIDEYKNSEICESAPVWVEIISSEFSSKHEILLDFLIFVEEYAQKTNDPVRPYSKNTWRDAWNAFKRL